MSSFQSGTGALTVVNSIGLAGAAVYFYNQTAELKRELERLRKEVSELRQKQENSDKATKKELKRLSKELALPERRSGLDSREMFSDYSTDIVARVGSVPRTAPAVSPRRETSGERPREILGYPADKGGFATAGKTRVVGEKMNSGGRLNSQRGPQLRIPLSLDNCDLDALSGEL